MIRALIASASSLSEDPSEYDFRRLVTGCDREGTPRGAYSYDGTWCEYM